MINRCPICSQYNKVSFMQFSSNIGSYQSRYICPECKFIAEFQSREDKK